MPTEAGRRLALARYLVGAATVVLTVVIVAAFVWGDRNRTLVDLTMLGMTVLATANCSLAAASSSGRLRTAWAGLAGACLSWTVGEAIWTWYELVLLTDAPFPGFADLGFLGFPLGAMLALAVFPANVSQADRRRMTLDGLMVATAIGLVSWGTALGAVVGLGGDSVLGVIVSVAYPASDIALVVVCILVLSRSQAHRVPLGFVAAGLVLMAVADSGYAYLVALETYATGNPVDLGWVFAFGLIALAPLAKGATSHAASSAGRAVAGVALPYIPLAVAVSYISWRLASGTSFSSLEVLLTTALVLLVLVRQFFAVRDNQQLASALAEREAQLRHQAFHDGLTGLANRALFVDRVTHALALHRRDGRPLAICFIDLDGFKTVNDTLGHSAGDDLLRMVSGRFGEELSEADTLARFGGDEYAVLVEDRADPVAVARLLLARLSEPFTIKGRTATVQASIGVARVDQFDETPSVDELLVRADMAMYAVKRRGKGEVLLHTPDLQLAEVDDASLGRSLAQALESGELTVAYQPIVELPTGRVHTLEALARWSPDGHALSPEVFIRVAEQCNLIGQLFQAVLAQTCAELARWTGLPGGSAIRAAVNVSPSQLSSREFPMIVAAELSRHGVTGDRLVLEITETERLADKAVALEVCHALRELGIRLSVDDFGTGLSSLARLRELPVDEVKVDRVFIAGVDHDADSLRFVRGVLALANEVGLTVVAEGVEREAERDALAALGCRRAQGYLFSRPVSAIEVDLMLAPPAWGKAAVPVPRVVPTAGRRIAREPGA